MIENRSVRIKAGNAFAILNGFRDNEDDSPTVTTGFLEVYHCIELPIDARGYVQNRPLISRPSCPIHR